MKFRTRLLTTYSLLVFFLVVILGITFYTYTSRLFENNAVSTYRLLLSRMSLHLDNLIRPMDFITSNLISDYDFRSALTTLATLKRSEQQNQPLINEASQTATSNLLTYSIQKNFYSVVVVTAGGDFFSSNFVNHRQVSTETIPLPDIPGYLAAKRAMGRPVLVPPHDDPWDTQQSVHVYGLARVVAGLNGDLAFIEVQNPVQDLDALFRVPNPRYVRILAIQADGSPFYESTPTSDALIQHFLSLSQSESDDSAFHHDPLTNRNELVISAGSSYTGVTLILTLDRQVLLQPLSFVGWSTTGVSVLIVLLSVFFNWISSGQLTKPLRLIRLRMEETELSNLPHQETIDHENDEVVALDRSFQRLRARLDESIKRELHTRTLSLQSRLDSLQAQVNPHFLYNILTVIAGKGLELGNEEIGEICDAIAAMLRYSTSTTARSATLAEEVDHTRSYLFLMKKRLERQLDFAFDIEPEILNMTMPKIVLQQIVENSVNHGFKDSNHRMEIGIHGYRADGHWIVEVSDNGKGFDEAVLRDVMTRIGELDLQAADRDGNDANDGDAGLAIGGLGLLNTYIRLHLYFRGVFLWRLENLREGGARVSVGADLPRPREER